MVLCHIRRSTTASRDSPQSKTGNCCSLLVLNLPLAEEVKGVVLSREDLREIFSTCLINYQWLNWSQ